NRLAKSFSGTNITLLNFFLDINCFFSTKATFTRPEDPDGGNVSSGTQYLHSIGTHHLLVSPCEIKRLPQKGLATLITENDRNNAQKYVGTSRETKKESEKISRKSEELKTILDILLNGLHSNISYSGTRRAICARLRITSKTLLFGLKLFCSYLLVTKTSHAPTD
ncbi:hypothetical protein Tcan_00763, partial [Toxocara canis]